MKKKQKKKPKYAIYLEGYSDATDDMIDTIISFNMIDKDFLHFILRDFFKKYKKEWEKIL